MGVATACSPRPAAAADDSEVEVVDDDDAPGLAAHGEAVEAVRRLPCWQRAVVHLLQQRERERERGPQPLGLASYCRRLAATGEKRCRREDQLLAIGQAQARIVTRCVIA
jgi:hypothetical protein